MAQPLSYYIGTVLASASQTEGVSEDFYFLRHLNQASKGDAASLAIIQSVRDAANTAADTAAVTEFDEMIANANILTSQQPRRLWIDGLNGSDVTGNGSLSRPYLTLEAAMAVIPVPNTTTYELYLFSGTQTVSTSFVWKENIAVFGIGSNKTAVLRSDLKEVPSNGSGGTFSFSNIAFNSGLKIQTTAAATTNVAILNCTSGGSALVFQLAAIADVAGATAGKYFLIDTPMDNYYHYYTVGGAGTDPAVAGRKRLVTDITSGDTAATIATKTVTSLGTTLQLAMHSNDFTVTTAGAPSGSFRITMFLPVDNGNVTDFNTGYVVTNPTVGRGVQLMGFSLTNFMNVTINSLEMALGTNAGFYGKFITGTMRNTVLARAVFDNGTTGGGITLTATDLQHQYMAVKGLINFVKRGSHNVSGGNIPGLRMSGRTSSQPIFNSGSTAELSTLNRITGCSTTSGSSIVTIPSGKNGVNFMVGVPIFGPGIPADTFVGDSRDLISTQIRIVNSAGTAVNSTQTRAGITLATRRMVFQDLAINSQFTNALAAPLVAFTPVNSSDWPASHQPTVVAQGLDALASRFCVSASIGPLVAQDITNQYVNLPYLFLASYAADCLAFKRAAATPLVMEPGANSNTDEFTLDTYTDTDGVVKSRLVFRTNWATGGGSALIVGDRLYVYGFIQFRDNF
jgi:hypothetical protein